MINKKIRIGKLGNATEEMAQYANDIFLAVDKIDPVTKQGKTVKIPITMLARSSDVNDLIEAIQSSIQSLSSDVLDLKDTKTNNDVITGVIVNDSTTMDISEGEIVLHPVDNENALFVAGSDIPANTPWNEDDWQRISINDCLMLLRQAVINLQGNKVSEAPNDGKQYARKNKSWVELQGGGGSGGLDSVAHDDTLTGDGTTGNPLSVVGGGSSSPSTLFKTVADMQAASLNVGDVVETAGFYSVGDGGGAKYQIQSSGTANGMDLIAVAGNKIAKVLLQETAYTEQIGYQVTTSKADVVPYIKQLISLGVQNIKFLRCGGAPNRTYCFRDCLDLTLSNFRNVGVNLEGADVGMSSGYATYFDFKPNSANTDKVMIKIRARSTKIKNIIMIYQEGLSDSSKRSVADCIRFEHDGGGNYGTSSFGTNLHELVIQGFGNAIHSCGPVGAGFVWHCDVSRCAFSSNDTHLKLEHQVYLFSVYDCLFNIPHVQSIYVNSPFTLMFESCNFGVGGAASTICKVAEWVDGSEHVDERKGNLKFLNCQYEFEYVNGAVVSDNNHLFVDNDDEAETQFDYDNCSFIITPLARESNFSNRLFSLGNKSSISFNNCLGSFTDVNYTGNSFLEKDFSKLYLDENRLPATKIGSIKITHSTGIEPEHFLDSAHLPCIAKDGNSILFDDSTPLDKFQLEDGLHLLNLDSAKVYVSCSRKVREVTSALSNVVRIGNELYEYVIIDGLKWISRNLSLRTKTRNWYIFDHPEWGVFYSQSNLAEITSALPSGWRLPTTQDILTLVGDGSATRARSLQSTQYPSVWANATNSTGFSATPSSWYHLPNTSQSQPTWGMYWSGSTESGGGRHNIWLKENAIARGGWSASDAANLKVPVRVCADA